MTPFIRPYAPSDRAECQAVFHRAVHAGAAEFYNQAQRAAWAPCETPDYSSPDRLLAQWCWVAEDKKSIVGFMSLTRNGFLDMAYVVPPAKGTGVADELYATLIEQAKSERLGTLTTNASHLARRFFDKQGWHVEYGENYATNGQVLERFHMSLDMMENT